MIQRQEKESPQNWAVKIRGDSNHLGEKEEAGNPHVPLKGLHTDSLTGTYPGLQWKNGSLGGIRDIQGKTELCGFRMGAKRAAVIVPLLSHPPVQPTGECDLACVESSLNMADYETALA